ncbi:MAG: T9SS type A sorting domain-containing protein [Saprospiraceae bacterium]|nr:T9SS type A sorting domain-containing protein [Saprospiraceae bacterium]MCF8252718.1 T9SS type A sorting domain-containing protein [Saprospiraceae bacterium]MCF8282942.1 T9SS type A sorting domain-containing protein [Bacteroidales bacterium]MCF8314287.1 T9SS type A sorting domain-containing protein [Saprospiraceae bacterium]MCF8443116.1 T9SS type A sorting domain-containing protein [Saprospiraceae bacterium]
MKQIYLSLSLFVACSMSLSAQVFVKQGAIGTNNGTSWVNAYTSLEAALAGTLTGQVWVAAGTYKPSLPTVSFVIPGGVSLYGGFAGTETTLGQRNPTANVTRLSGDLLGDDIAGNLTTNRTDNALHVIAVGLGLTGSVVIDGFTISGGNTPASGITSSGGGIVALSPVIVRNCNLNNNFGATGGAIYLAKTADGSQVKNCTISDNLSVGAIYLDFCDDVDVDSCTFTKNNNTTASSNAGAFYVAHCLNLSLSNSTFSENTAPSGGALYCTSDSLPAATNPDNFVISACNFHNNSNTTSVGGAGRFRNSSYSLIDCIFESNTSSSSGGHIRNDNQAEDNVIYTNTSFKNGTSGGWGGAFTGYGGTFTVTGCDFEENSCTRLGGASNNGFGGTMTYTDCTFTNNSAAGTASGGALALQNDLTTVNAINCSFSGNNSTGNGGAIFSGANASSSPVNVMNCEFVGNVADGFGGAIHMADNGPNNDATLTVTNSIFNFNSALDQGGAINISDANTTITSCLFTNNDAKSGTVAPKGRGGAISINVDTATLDVVIMNSTFANNIGEFSAGISSWTGAEDVSFSNTTLQNNIFAQDGSINYAIEAGMPTITSNGGNLYDDDTFDAYLTHAKDLKVDDISGLFVDPDDDNYRLQNDAVARDKGVSAGAPATDIEGNPRNGEVDMGAYENQNPNSANEVLLENNGMLTLSPNPAAGQSTSLVLDNQWTGTVELRLTNLLGQTVKTFEVTKSTGKMSFELPLNGLSQGIYQVAASNGSQVVVQQLARN